MEKQKKEVEAVKTAVSPPSQFTHIIYVRREEKGKPNEASDKLYGRYRSLAEAQQALGRMTDGTLEGTKYRVVNKAGTVTKEFIIADIAMEKKFNQN